VPGPTSKQPTSSKRLGASLANRPRLLLVDDEAPVLASTAALLSEDYDVETADNGRAALALLTKMEFDIVCTDLNMPGMGGFELLRRVSEMPGHIGRVLITGYREYLDRAPDERSWFLVVKPYDPAHLLKVIERAWSATQLRRTAAEAARLTSKV